MGRGALAAGRGRHFSWPLGSFSRRRQDLGWGVGSKRGPAAAPASSPLWVPEIARSRLSGRPRARHPTVRVTPAPLGLPPYLRPLRPDYLRTHRAVRARTRRHRRRRRRALSGAGGGDPSPAPPRPGPAPPGGCAGALPPAPLAPRAIRPHFADGKTKSVQRQFPKCYSE